METPSVRAKVNTLKAALKERHSERNELRRELQQAQAALDELRQKASATAAPANSPAEPDLEED